MAFSSRRNDRQTDTSDERRCSHGSRRENLALRPALAPPEDRRLPDTRRDPCGGGVTRSTVPVAAINLLWTVGTWSVLIAPVVGLIWAGPPAEAPVPGGPPGSGIIVRNEVVAIWMPPALRDLARLQARPESCPTPGSLQADLARGEWRTAWYAITYRGHQVDGRSEDITQIRRLSEAADHLDELQAVMATAAGKPPRCEGRNFAHARVEVMPEALQALDPRDAITRPMARPIIREKDSPADEREATHSPVWRHPSPCGSGLLRQDGQSDRNHTCEDGLSLRTRGG